MALVIRQVIMAPLTTSPNLSSRAILAIAMLLQALVSMVPHIPSTLHQDTSASHQSCRMISSLVATCTHQPQRHHPLLRVVKRQLLNPPHHHLLFKVFPALPNWSRNDAQPNHNLRQVVGSHSPIQASSLLHLRLLTPTSAESPDKVNEVLPLVEQYPLLHQPRIHRMVEITAVLEDQPNLPNSLLGLLPLSIRDTNSSNTYISHIELELGLAHLHHIASLSIYDSASQPLLHNIFTYAT